MTRLRRCGLMATSHVQIWLHIQKAFLSNKQPAESPEVRGAEAERRDDRRGDVLSEKSE